MKRFLLAIALACVLSGPALAGEIHSVGAPAPGDIHSTDAPAPQASSLVVVAIILTILSLVRR
jgi:predicted cobalt transporter CbtA